MPSRFAPIPAGTDQSQMIATMNNNFAQLDNEGVTKVFYNDQGKPSMTLGLLPEDQGQGFVLSDGEERKRIVMNIDSDNVASFKVLDKDGKAAIAASIGTDEQPYLKVAKSGYDATTASNDQLIFNSAQNIFKVVLSGTTSLSYDGSVNTFKTIAHGQSYIPIVLAYVQFPNDPTNFTPMQNQYVPMPVYMNRSGLPFVQCVQSVDATNIYLRVHDIYASVGTPMTYNFRYYVLQETSS